MDYEDSKGDKLIMKKKETFSVSLTWSWLFSAIVCKAFWEKGPLGPRKELRNN